MMGRNILSICDECEVYIFHLRGKEGDLMQKFQNTHSDHERSTRIVSDYVDEQPEHYEDVTDDLTTSTPLPEQGEITLETKELAEISLYMFEQYRKEFYTSGKHHVAIPQFHRWLQQLIKENEDTNATN